MSFKCITHVFYFSGSLSLSQEVLSLVMSLPKLKSLTLNIRFAQLNPLDEMKQLKHLKILLPRRHEFNFASLSDAINKMPALINLTLYESSHDFCKNFAFAVVQQIVSRGKYVIIKPLYLSPDSRTGEIEIFGEQDIFSKSEDSCFKLWMQANCLDWFSDCYDSNKMLLPECFVFIKDNEDYGYYDDYSGQYDGGLGSSGEDSD